MTTVQYDFEEMQISGDGLLAYGTATLTSACEDDGEFYVSEIVLHGGQVLTRPSRINSANVFNETLFTLIVKQIEDDRTTHGKHAALEWTDAVSGQVSDFVPALRRRHGMPMVRVPEISPRGSVHSVAAE